VAGRLVLDSGALIGWQRKDRTVWRHVTDAIQRDAMVVVPAVVIAECIRGGGSDAPIHRLLVNARVPIVGKRAAMQAGRLLGIAAMSATIDAFVAAEAIRGGPCVLLTSDPDDMESLVGRRPYVEIVAV